MSSYMDWGSYLSQRRKKLPDVYRAYDKKQYAKKQAAATKKLLGGKK